MNTNLGSDDFYVLNPNSGDHFSVAGIQFLTEMVDQAVRSVGWDPTKVCIGASYTSLWVGYPSAATKLVEGLHVKDGKLMYRPRKAAPGDKWPKSGAIPLANPDFVKHFGEILVYNLPKTSKFYTSKKASANGQPV
jgi:hypothetical protein